MSGKAKKVAKKEVKKAAPKVAKKAPKKGGKSVVKKDFKSEHGHLFRKEPKDYRIGQDLLPRTRNLSRYVKWPRYVRMQRQKSVLLKRIKVPPSINQFTQTLDKNQAANLFRFLSSYRPESPQEKANRLKAAASAEAKGEETASTKPKVLKFGLNHVTQLVEEKRARLVVIAHDVDPIELVVWLPALCRKMDVPYMIVKGKARLGHFVYQKTCAVMAVTDIRKEHASSLDQLISSARSNFNDNESARRKWGGGIMGVKAQAKARLREKARAQAASQM
jgi:large subunit ribosomal protein L7Ae